MKRFKKRTLALVLASVVTVAGSFASERYKNSLMELNFVPRKDKSINMVLQTKDVYSGAVVPTKINSQTYVLNLPNVNSVVEQPNLSKVGGCVKDVKIETFPYTNEADGYTKITVTVNPEIALYGKAQLFLSGQGQGQAAIQGGSGLNSITGQDTQFNLMLILGFLVVMLLILLAYKNGRDKLNDLVGDNNNIEVDFKDAKKTEKPKPEPRKTGPVVSVQRKNSDISRFSSQSSGSSNLDKLRKLEEEKNITIEKAKAVDMDELFKQQVQVENPEAEVEEDDDENLALEEFLQGFSFDEDIEPEKVLEENLPLYDEALYNEIINNADLKFTNDDAVRINKLLNNEINDDTLRNIDKYLVSNPIKKRPSKKEILEDLIITYSIERNVSFSPEDIEALNNLIHVELDSDFVTDLRTNPERTQTMTKEIEADKEHLRKKSSMLTLNVKDMLPDLSEALENKAKGKLVQEKKQSEVIYVSEGYEVSTLSIAEGLPDLSKEINNKDAYKSKPSASIQYVDTSYEVEKLSLNDELPDLEDALKNPQKYKEEKPEVVVDESALLNNILNVEFKPFDDGTRDFEILNDIEDLSDELVVEEEKIEEIVSEKSLTEQIEKPETANNEVSQPQKAIEEKDKQLTNQEGIKPQPAVPQQPKVEAQQSQAKPEPQVKQPVKPQIKHQAQKPSVEADLKRVVPQKQAMPQKEKLRPAIQADRKPVSASAKQQPAPAKKKIDMVVGGETYVVVSSVEIDRRKGCHLAKGENGYVVLSYVNKKITVIKKYDALKSEKIQARLSEKISDETSRYLIRIGLNKFVIDVTEDEIKYVMDLC
ncbi:MAG: hypothetical protein E7Z89_03500 [Cyanobacteria bacterium SIG28]|nr:hypothetical protein [Cyanobacteria bacterium SIG28]